MADWGPWVGDSINHVGAISNVIPSATAHTKGSWVAAASGTDRGEGLRVIPTYLQGNATARTLLVDVGMGSTEQTIISNLMLCPPSVNVSEGTSRTVAQAAYFPIHIPSGNVLKARAQSSIASHSGLYFYANRVSSGLPCVGSVVDTYGADTANSRGTVLTAPNTDGGYGSWAQVSASCSRVKALLIAIGNGNQSWTTYSNQWYSIQIGVGAAASEQTIIAVEEAGGSSSGTGTVSQMILGPYYVDIPAGSRISARVAKQYASSSQRTVDVVLYGIR